MQKACYTAFQILIFSCWNNSALGVTDSRGNWCHSQDNNTISSRIHLSLWRWGGRPPVCALIVITSPSSLSPPHPHPGPSPAPQAVGHRMVSGQHNKGSERCFPRMDLGTKFWEQITTTRLSLLFHFQDIRSFLEFQPTSQLTCVQAKFTRQSLVCHERFCSDPPKFSQPTSSKPGLGHSHLTKQLNLQHLYTCLPTNPELLKPPPF